MSLMAEMVTTLLHLDKEKKETPQRKWVYLTNTELMRIYRQTTGMSLRTDQREDNALYEFARAVETMLKVRNV